MKPIAGRMDKLDHPISHTASSSSVYQSDPPTSTYPYDAEVLRDLLKKKRRARPIKSCYPCRQRKVRCDGGSPCASCRARNHPELCSLSVPSPSRPTVREEALRDGDGKTPSTHGFPPTGNPGVNDCEVNDRVKFEQHLFVLSKDNVQLSPSASMTESVSQTTPSDSGTYRAVGADNTVASDDDYRNHADIPPGRHVIENETGAAIYLGPRSDTTMALGCTEYTAGGMITGTELFVPRAFPFTNLWEPHVDIKEVCQALPGDSDMIR